MLACSTLPQSTAPVSPTTGTARSLGLSTVALAISHQLELSSRCRSHFTSTRWGGAPRRDGSHTGHTARRSADVEAVIRTIDEPVFLRPLVRRAVALRLPHRARSDPDGCCTASYRNRSATSCSLIDRWPRGLRQLVETFLRSAVGPERKWSRSADSILGDLADERPPRGDMRAISRPHVRSARFSLCACLQLLVGAEAARPVRHRPLAEALGASESGAEDKAHEA